MGETTTSDDRIERVENLMARVWEAFAETDRRFRETDQRFKETDRRLDERFTELSQRIEALSAEVQASTKKWGELSNRLGRLAEDFVAPSIPQIFRAVIGCPDGELDMLSVRTKRRHVEDRGRGKEFDVVAAYGDYVLVNETKSQLKVEDVDRFVELMEEIRAYFPEYAGRRFIGALASLYVDRSVVEYGSRKGVLVLGLGKYLMEVLNGPDFKPKEF